MKICLLSRDSSLFFLIKKIYCSFNSVNKNNRTNTTYIIIILRIATEENSRKCSSPLLLRVRKSFKQLCLPEIVYTLVKKIPCQTSAIRNVTITQNICILYKIWNAYYTHKDESKMFKFFINHTYFSSFLWL